jgi:alpha-galactosidase
MIKKEGEICDSKPFVSKLIHFDGEQGVFFLHSSGATYAMQILEYGHLAHLHWGASLANQKMSGVFTPHGRAFSPNPIQGNSHFNLDTTPLEYPTYGNSDFRSPALEIFHPATGSRILDLRYVGHCIMQGKPSLENLPATYVDALSEAETLVITLRDTSLNVAVELCYTAFSDHPVITRSVRILNESKGSLVLKRVLSCSLDFSSHLANFHFTQLHGAWARETQLTTSPLRPGTQSIESRRGASSHAHNPFFALTELPGNEEYGEAYGFSLVYSGNFVALAECDSYRTVRAQMGINPFDFSWALESGHSFQAPESVLVFSTEGLGGMSRVFHRFYRRHLIPQLWRDRTRPVLLNNWEATYFDFDSQKIEKIAKSAAALGVELLVLDDGWFGHRDDATTSLGDWVAHPKKFPHGLADLAERVRKEGIQFGLWFEPEMVSPDSDLYRAHPDWCLHVPTHPRTEGRDQLILDLSRGEVCEEIFQRVSSVLRSVPISYVKWDMNRNMTEIASAGRLPAEQQETAHRYMLGLYGLLERFQKEFPEVLFEGCSGGGGRFDPGILRYMPQVWASDNSDAIARLRIQYGASLIYPLSALSAHVSIVPNHQVGRITPLRTRGHVAYTGSFGYELDLGELSAEEQEEVREQIQIYKQRRLLLVRGDLYRLRSPFQGQEAAWMVVSPDQGEALITHVTILTEANPPLLRLQLRGLDANAIYRLNGETLPLRGDFLMQIGIAVPEPQSDFISHQWHLQRI